MPRQGSSADGRSAVERWKKIIVEGATPKVTTSARESSSLPIGDDTFSRRADMPSKKSNAAPTTIKSKASDALP